MLRHILIKLWKTIDKEKILKTAREKQQITYKEIPITLSADFSAETAGQKGVAQYISSDEREKPTVKNTLPNKAVIHFLIVL